MSQNTYIFQLVSIPTKMYNNMTHSFGSICCCVYNRRAERTKSSPVPKKAMHEVVLGEYSVINIYENFGGGDVSPGKIEFGVVVVRFKWPKTRRIPSRNSSTVLKLLLVWDASYFRRDVMGLPRP